MGITGKFVNFVESIIRRSMNIREFINGVHYVGVNDRVSPLFEALWPLPYGVSYNSYLVKGSRGTALIDAVEAASATDLFSHINCEDPGSKVDYLVVNHMEPDHSGSIPLVISAYPEIKIAGNRQTLAMLKGYYHVDDANLMEIKEGDVIDLGGKTLRFSLTPMVHWPETMMTWLEEDKALFTGDAFGCFGALNGAVVDEDMDTEVYFREMYRYYSNIVGKYGKFVVKALDKIKALDIEYLCSTHGPVWHADIKRVHDIYSRLAAYEPEDGVVIVYGSMYGNTGEVAEMIASELAARGVRNIKIHNASYGSLSEMISDAFRYKGLIVGAPTYSMTMFPAVAQFMEAMVTREVKNKVFGTFGSHTWASVVPKALQGYADRLGWNVCASLEIKHSADDTTQARAAEFADSFLKAYNGGGEC